MKPRVNFFCIGAQKAGTTSIHDVLVQHPDIYLPEKKEAQFFDVSELYENGISYYNSFFKQYKNEKLIGNVNPNLSLSDKIIDRIIQTYGKDLKILFILRNPVERSYSHYLMSKYRGFETLDFIDAINIESKRISNPKIHHKNYKTKELGHFEKNHLGYIYRSKYSRTIKKIYSEFPKENIKILFFDDFLSNRYLFFNEIFKFLNLEFPKNINLNIKSNSAKKRRFQNYESILHKLKIFKIFIPKKLE